MNNQIDYDKAILGLLRYDFNSLKYNLNSMDVSGNKDGLIRKCLLGAIIENIEIKLKELIKISDEEQNERLKQYSCNEK